MATTDILGRSIPTPTDSTDLARILGHYSLSDAPVVVGSRTEANSLLAEVNAACDQAGIPRRPLTVWRTDYHRLELHPNRGHAGESWEYLGGRRHEATIKFSRTLQESPSSPLVLHGQSVTNASPGFTLGGPDSQNVILPAPGWWRFQATVNLDGAAGSVGRTFFQFHTTSGEVRHRIGATNENNYGGDVEEAFSAGDAVRIQCYHEGGGSRLWTATVHVKWDGPRWGA